MSDSIDSNSQSNMPPDKALSTHLKHGQAQQAIADLVQALPKGTHLTAPEVYRQAREAGMNISLSSVYRALNQLQAHGNVSTLGGERGRRYESGHGDDHDHLICLKCGLTIE